MFGMDRVDIRALRRSLLAGQPLALAVPQAAYWLDDLKLFAATVLGGLVFFGTFIA